MSTHTPTLTVGTDTSRGSDPSNVHVLINNGDGTCETYAVAKGSIQAARARAAYIVRACNAHEALVKALEAIAARSIGEWDHPSLKDYVCSESTIEDVEDIARAALTLAEGK